MPLLRPGDTERGGDCLPAKHVWLCRAARIRTAAPRAPRSRAEGGGAGGSQEPGPQGPQPLNPAEGRDWPTDSRCIGFHILQLRFSTLEGQKHPAEIEEGEKEPLSELDSAAAQADHRRGWGVSARGLPPGGPCCGRRGEGCA